MKIKINRKKYEKFKRISFSFNDKKEFKNKCKIVCIIIKNINQKNDI